MQQQQPPQKWLQFLRWFCKDDFIEEIEGDLTELFEKRADHSVALARRHFMWDVIKTIRWINMKKRKIESITMYAIDNYLKIYIRRFRRGFLHYSVNILGLVLGFTVLFFVLLYSNDEMKMDSYHSKSDRIFRVIEKSETEEGTNYYSSVANPMAPAMKADFPEIVESASMVYFGSATYTYKDKNIANRNYAIVTSGFFNIWDISILSGDPLKDYQGLAGVVLSEDFAKSLFGDEDPVGKVIETRLDKAEVLAVMKNMPKNATYQFDIFFVTDINKWDGRISQFFKSWDSHFMATWVLFREGTGPEDVLPKTDAFLSKYVNDDQKREHQIGFQNIQDMHLHSDHLTEAGGDPLRAIPYSNNQFVYIILIIGACVIIIASLNFINLSSVQALKRTLEAGIRKVNGASTKQLRIQLFVETFITILLAFILSWILIALLLPYFNYLTGKTMYFDEFFSLDLIGYQLAAFTTTWILSALVPAVYYAKLDRAIFMTKNAFAGKGDRLRKAFVLVQYTISMGLIIGVVVLYNQFNFIQNKNLGFDNSGLITLDINSGKARGSFKGIKDGIAKHPGVVNVTTTTRVPGEWKNLPESDLLLSKNAEPITASHYGFDSDGISTYGFKIIDGSDFSGNDASDTLKVILNETAVKSLGLEDPVGKSIWIQEDTLSRFQVIGVVEDFHFESLYEPIKPVFITSWNNPIMVIDYFVIRYNGDPKQVLTHAENVNTEFDPETPAEFNFLDEQWRRYYKADETRGNFIMISAILSVLISVIGLFGMIHYTVERRTKEIGIRKVIGASIPTIIKLLLKDYLILLCVAMLIASPLAWYMLNDWLATFAFRIDLSIWIFAFAFLVVLLVSFMTVISRVYSMAKSNPVNSLRYE